MPEDGNIFHGICPECEEPIFTDENNYEYTKCPECREE